MEIIVPDDQLSLAIGRRGQNVRLASQLTGWKLDINSESRVRELHDFAMASFTAISIPEATRELLYAHGLRKAQDIAEAAPEMLTQFPGLDMDMIPDLQRRAREQRVVDTEEEIRLEQEREAARQAEARRHPDELSQDERLARVRGVGEKTIEQLRRGGYTTVEAIHQEADVNRLGDSTELGPRRRARSSTRRACTSRRRPEAARGARRGAGRGAAREPRL